MSTYTVTAGKGKSVHVAAEGKTLCGTENRPAGKLVLLNSNDDATCKNCIKLMPVVDNDAQNVETENMDEHLNDMNDAERFVAAMEGHGYVIGVTANDATGMEAVTVRHTFPSGTRVTTRVVFRHGVFESGRFVSVDSKGHHTLALTESEVASMTYAQNYDYTPLGAAA